MVKLSRPSMDCCTETAKLVVHMQEAVKKFHQLHLKITGQGSFASHKALEEFYSGIPDHVDNLVEQLQGAEEKLISYPESPKLNIENKAQALSELRILKAEIDNLQSIMPYSEIVNILDETKSLINSVKYKLLFLS